MTPEHASSRMISSRLRFDNGPSRPLTYSSPAPRCLLARAVVPRLERPRASFWLGNLETAMADGDFFRDESRTAPRFVPQNHLSMFLAGSAAPFVHGDIKDLSETGACVRTDTALDSGGVVTINVRNGYSFLFRAEARIVWRSTARPLRESFDCAHGILFTELSPFTRKLIRRLGDTEGRPVVPPAGAAVEGLIWDSDSDPDLQIMFRAERSPTEVDEDRLDDPVLEAPLLAEQIESPGVPELARESVPLRQPPEVDAPGDDFDLDLDSPSLDRGEPSEWSDAFETVRHSAHEPSGRHLVRRVSR